MRNLFNPFTAHFVRVCVMVGAWGGWTIGRRAQHVHARGLPGGHDRLPAVVGRAPLAPLAPLFFPLGATRRGANEATM